jgi:hypothetical protein
MQNNSPGTKVEWFTVPINNSNYKFFKVYVGHSVWLLELLNIVGPSLGSMLPFIRVVTKEDL